MSTLANATQRFQECTSCFYIKFSKTLKSKIQRVTEKLKSSRGSFSRPELSMQAKEALQNLVRQSI